MSTDWWKENLNGVEDAKSIIFDLAFLLLTKCISSIGVSTRIETSNEINFEELFSMFMCSSVATLLAVVCV